MSKLVMRYMLLVTLLGLFVIFVFGNGFSITDQYFFSSKNQVGPFLASVATMSLLYLLDSSGKNLLLLNKKVLFVIFLINFASLLIIRNRSGLVALAICFFVFFLSKISFKKQFRREILLLPIITLIGALITIKSNILNLVVAAVSKSLFNNYDTTDLDSLSAGRYDVYLAVLEYIKTSPFFGEIVVSSGIGDTPHNFLLNLWLEYGLLGMLPITVFYIFLWVFVIYKTVIMKKFDLSFYMILFMLVISLFEYSYPFSPLTTVSFSWFLMGYYLKNKKNNKYSEETAW